LTQIVPGYDRGGVHSAAKLVNARHIAPNRRKRSASSHAPPAESGIKIPTPSVAAIEQSRTLRAQLKPPREATNCERPPVAYIEIDDTGRSIVTVEGPLELEADQRHAGEGVSAGRGRKDAKGRTGRSRKRG
jgi:hypothetical protein